MARPNITDLALPQRRYRPDLHSRNFETVKSAQAEDALRVRLLDAIKHPGEFGAKVKDLAHRLRLSATSQFAESPASKLYMRNQRVRIFGHLWDLVESARSPVSTFTVVKQDWIRFPENLEDLDPICLKIAFRQDLYRAGAASALGFLFSALDCEFNPDCQSYQPHLHGIASGEMIQVLDRLRSRPSYKPWSSVGRVPGCANPIVLSRKDLTNLPSSISYGMKGFWKVQSWGRTRRIPEPFGSQALIYLDRFRLADITLLTKLHVSNGLLLHAA